MSSRFRALLLAAVVVPLVVPLVATPALAQAAAPRAWAANVVVPQGRSFRPAGDAAIVHVSDITASIEILEQVATTTLEIGVRNASNRAQETELLVPVPLGATVRGFAFHGSDAEASAKLLPAAAARRLYASIVARLRDPGLLQFAGHAMLRSSVFPVPARGTQRVRIVYEELLPADGVRVDYVLPRTEDLGYAVPWTIKARVRTERPIATVYSPSHGIETRRSAKNAVVATVPAAAARQPGSFRLSYLRAAKGVTASLMAYPDPASGGGTFLLLAGVPTGNGKADGLTIRREVTLVIDRSGSMKNGKLDQVRESVLQILAGLHDGERFNLISYNDTIELFAMHPVVKGRESIEQAKSYLSRLTPQGGTNLHDALVEALRQKPSDEVLPIVLFLTDGLPTVGERSEVKIREIAEKANPHQRRVFTIGVGLDVNTPLLDKVSRSTRAKATFILPEEDIEVKVGQVFRRLRGPVLASPQLAAAASESGAPRVGDLFPRRLDDLFEGDQLVVLGRYRGDAPLEFTLGGNFLGQSKAFRFRFDLSRATTRNAFVPRLWASRKIAFLIDQIRDSGADPSLVESPAAVAADPKFKELVDEIVRLSLEYGILTEYTAFMADAGTDLAAGKAVWGKAAANFDGRARGDRSGLGSVNQDFNNGGMRGQSCLNGLNEFMNDRMERVDVRTVQQMGDRAYFLRRGLTLPTPAKDAWVDSRLVSGIAALKIDRKVARGSAEYLALADHLAANGRQGCLALASNLLLRMDGQVILVHEAR